MRTILSIALALFSPLAAFAGGLYPMENGGPRRENRSLSPSSLTNPLAPLWASKACLDLKDPNGNPVVMADRVAQSFLGGVRCFDRATGQRLWTWTCDPLTNVWGAPCYDPDRDRLYINCHNGDTIALDAATGSVAWYLPHSPSSFPWQYSSPLYVDGKLYVGNGGTKFLCLDPDTRAVLWEFNYVPYLGIGLHPRL
jgi:outer membrane protein assembly factor BamB